MKMTAQAVPVFFATDNNYLPFLAVTIRSLIDNASDSFTYIINIMNTGLDPVKMVEIEKMQKSNVAINFIDVSEKLAIISEKLILRDYYSPSIYYRLFIPSMFPEYRKALYLDCDIVILRDISELYCTDLCDNLVAAIPDGVVACNKIFKEYVQTVIGVRYESYFNSGVMAMNLDTFRSERIEERFIEIFNTYNFSSVAPDQDYLNFLCQGKVIYLDKSWNKMTTGERYEGELKLIHYNMYKKPWHYSKVEYSRYFWNYAKKTSFYSEILETKNNFTTAQKYKNIAAGKKLMQHAVEIIGYEKTFNKTLNKK